MLERPVFRSVVALASQGRNGYRQLAKEQQRAERSGLVVAALGARRIAIPVEQVERVLRSFSTLPAILYMSRQMPFADLTRPLGLKLAVAERLHRRIVIVGDGVRRWAVPVDLVYDVTMVDTLLIVPLSAEDSDARNGVLGRIEHRGEGALVIDAVKILTDTAMARAR